MNVYKKLLLAVAASTFLLPVHGASAQASGGVQCIMKSGCRYVNRYGKWFQLCAYSAPCNGHVVVPPRRAKTLAHKFKHPGDGVQKHRTVERRSEFRSKRR